MTPATRKDLDRAAPGIYLVRCKHPSKPQPDDEVLAGPLPATTEADQRDARNRATRESLKIGHQVEVVQVIGF